MHQMRMYGMYRCFQTLLESRQHLKLNNEQLLQMLLQAEWDDRHNRRIARFIQLAKFRFVAHIEEMDFSQDRKLDKELILRLADCSFLDKGENVLITGPTGVGKSFLVSALGHQGCIKGYKVLYFNAQKLFALLRAARSEGTLLKQTNRMDTFHLIIIDDFGLQPLEHPDRLALLDILEDRYKKSSVMISSQLPVKEWYQIIQDNTIADAILDRLVHNAHRIQLQGVSLRKKYN